MPPEEAAIISEHIKNHHVDLRLYTKSKEIKGDNNGKVRSVITSSGEEIYCQFAGIAVGVSPSISFIQNTGIETDRGVLVKEYLKPMCLIFMQ